MLIVGRLSTGTPEDFPACIPLSDVCVLLVELFSHKNAHSIVLSPVLDVAFLIGRAKKSFDKTDLSRMILVNSGYGNRTDIHGSSNQAGRGSVEGLSIGKSRLHLLD
ncbi:hypothetical protein Tco_0382853 [Tanacetum coccineum]